MSSNPPIPSGDPVGDPPSRRGASRNDEDLVRENERLKAALRTKDLETENAALKAENEAFKKKEQEREAARIAAETNAHDVPSTKPKPAFSLK